MMDVLAPKFSALQREARKKGLPVMIVFEGWGASGKGTLINRLIQPLDPRGFKVFTVQEENEEERMHPFLWRFWLNSLRPTARVGMQVETINYHTYTKYGKVQINQQRVGVGRFFDRFYRLSDDNGTHRQFLGLW